MAKNSRETIDRFLAQRKLALVGMSRGGRKFGNTIFRELTAKGYSRVPGASGGAEIGGERCWPRLADLPEPVGGVVIVVPPAQTERVVADAARAGVPRVWMQQGSESDAAVRACEAAGIEVVRGECILMFAEPAGAVHRFHRWLWRRAGEAAG